MKNEITTRKMCRGLYTVARGKHSHHTMVTVGNHSIADGDVFNGWVARAEWANDWYTDPLPTKRDAVRCAKEMIEKHEVEQQKRSKKV